MCELFPFSFSLAPPPFAITQHKNKKKNKKEMSNNDQVRGVADSAPTKKSSMVPENILESMTETLAYAEEVRTALLQLFAVAGDDPDMLAELPPLLQARVYLVLAKTATSLLSVQLRCTGVDPDDHPISKEFDRLSLCGERLGRYKDWDKAPLRPSTKINKRGAARVISHALPQLTAEQRESLRDISRGNEARMVSFTDKRARKKRKHQGGGSSSSGFQSVRQAAEEFLQKAAKELVMCTDPDGPRGPLRNLADMEEHEQVEQET
ncbi:Nuclear nucleic acid-binding protein C1D [Rhynchospora pubera]|uniref:Nuclear nucleic acid-binding protein C1D n=1 Tax=Rhynchospora pubera TaxID=906938 RepID=A0AAV8FF84_9POAL|nr:Nuclear nucleic acid-binding protein C1D [Rhynchospora pubera]